MIDKKKHQMARYIRMYYRYGRKGDMLNYWKKIKHNFKTLAEFEEIFKYEVCEESYSCAEAIAKYGSSWNQSRYLTCRDGHRKNTNGKAESSEAERLAAEIGLDLL